MLAGVVHRCGDSALCRLIFESVHDKTYNKTCATSKVSDQSAQTRSLIRVFADRLCLLQPPGDPRRDKREREWMYRLIWVFACHAGLIVDFVMRWLFSCSRFYFVRFSMSCNASKRTFDADNEDPDQTLRMIRLIWVFVGCTCQMVRFFRLRHM